ncbi:hypothetical protein KCU81_g5053, partial [Aureobasidium melanogenum]
MFKTVTGLLAIPVALITTIFATPAYSQDWPYNLPPDAKYYPEHEHRIRRDVEIQQKLNLTSPCGMRKMSDDEGEKFFLDYWQFNEQAFDSIEMDKPLHARRYWMRICIDRYNYHYTANSYCDYWRFVVDII